MKDKKCYLCGKVFKIGDKVFYWYHGDQDDRLCENCAKKEMHTDTIYSGTNVFNSDVSESFGGVF